MTQAFVAEQIGLSHQSSYRIYEAGTLPPPDKLAKLADLFGVSTDYLLGREPEAPSLETHSPADLEEAMARVTALEARAVFERILAKRPTAKQLEEVRAWLAAYLGKL